MVPQTVPLENHTFVPCHIFVTKKEGVLTKTAKMTNIYVPTSKQETAKITKMAGVTRAKACLFLFPESKDPDFPTQMDPGVGVAPTTPDPYTSADASRYKWWPYCDTNWWRICSQEEGIL